ncbi:1477_t:CDS:1 [Funneliformis mosseae]|uniref:1477_t:CDS:1 n=1 Tax=Funneliformis mosseae TaxID=27381 RepID=A0A9N9HAM2_FUNMO|nr:1477_t:CDS:1 [Funneliformis mosseae]
MHFSNNSSRFLSLFIIFSQLIITSYSTPFSSHLQKRDFSGRGTFYDPSLGACGKVSSGSDLIVALNAAQFDKTLNPNNNPICGKSVTITGPDGTVTCRVEDRCPSCPFGGLDLSRAAFDKISNLDRGIAEITWHFN